MLMFYTYWQSGMHGYFIVLMTNLSLYVLFGGLFSSFPNDDQGSSFTENIFGVLGL